VARETDEKRMRLRYASACRVCGIGLDAGAEAIYERASKTVRCIDHGPGSVVYAARTSDIVEPDAPYAVEAGTAGASARREFERRKVVRDARVRAKHPRLGGLMLALTGQPQSTTAWDVGAVGEERLGKGLDRIAGDTVRLLHDRRIPRSTGNIDHLAVAASGVYVVDAKKYRGRPQLRVDGGLVRPRVERLLVGSRDCSKLVDGVLKQVQVVRDQLSWDIPVHGVLCFVEADWPLFGGSFTARGVEALWPKRLYYKLQADGPLTAFAISEIHRYLAQVFPVA
jgi:hypothetical protein